MIRKALRKTASRFAAGVDRAMRATASTRARLRGRQSTAESLSPEERVEAMTRLMPLYDRPELFAQPDTFFPEADEVTPTRRRIRRFRGGHGVVLDLTWPSAFEPYAEQVRERYLHFTSNMTAAARVFLHKDRPRPVIILIHGYLGGRFAFEERVWPIRWFFDLGLDVALAVLPHHGVRTDSGAWPRFPSSDPRINVEGFRQAIFDLRTLKALLEARGAPSTGVAGMSLGGYTTSLWATLQPDLTFAIPMIPLASVADFARDTGRFTGTPGQQRAQHGMLEQMLRPISPLSRPAAIAPERLLVLNAEGDRITPPYHARRLQEHFDCRLETFMGGHLLQFGRREAFRHMARHMARAGVLPSRDDRPPRPAVPGEFEPLAGTR